MTANEFFSGPTIVTVKLASDQQVHLNELRRKDFPAHLNHLDAHITLFHAIPPALQAQAIEDMTNDASCLPSSLEISSLMKLGSGVALKVESKELLLQRARWVTKWRNHLTAQDERKNELHVTIQNKVPRERANELFESLHESFEPYRVNCEGLSIWQYRNGPWNHVVDLLRTKYRDDDETNQPGLGAK